MRVEINPGDVFGRLTVVQRNYQIEHDKVMAGKQRRPYYDCICECGNTKTVMHYDLVRQTRSCGCLQRENSGTTPTDLNCRTFGGLFVVKQDETKPSGSGKHAYWVCRCSYCGREKSIRSSDLLSGKTDCGCQAAKRASDQKIINLSGHTFGHLEVRGRDLTAATGSGIHTRWLCRCDICGCVESVSGQLLRDGLKDRCHWCSHKSLGEAKIIDLLRDNGVAFIHDKSYLNCKYPHTGGMARFDFIIPVQAKNDVTYIIEFDGEQHFRPAPGWDNTDSFESRLFRDEYKNKWCEENGIPLIRIPYTRLKSLSVDDLLLDSSAFLVVKN